MADELSRRLAAYESDLVATLQVAPVEAVRARGERRRIHTYAAAVASVMAVLIGAAVAVTGGRGPDRTPAGDTTDGWVSAGELAGLTLPHERELGYVLRVSVGEPSAVRPCAGWNGPPLRYDAIADPTRIGRTAARTVTSQPGPNSLHPGQLEVLTSQVLLFSSADLALGATRELADGFAACGWMVGVGAFADGGYDRLVGQRSLARGDPETTVVESALVFAAGNAVAIVYSREPQRTGTPTGAAAGTAMTELARGLCSIARCEAHPPPPFSGFPSLDPPPTYGPSVQPSEVSPYPTPLGQQTQPPPVGGESGS